MLFVMDLLDRLGGSAHPRTDLNIAFTNFNTSYLTLVFISARYKNVNK